MKKNSLKLAAILSAVFSLLFFVNYSSAQTTNYCYCHNDSTFSATCLPVPSSGICSSISGYTCPSDPLTRTECDLEVQKYNNENRSNLGGTGQQTSGQQSGGVMSKILPACVFETNFASDAAKDCRDVTIFLVLMFNIINYLFGIIGGVALLFFVYGGFVFILSQGSAEKVAKGKSIIVAAVLGIIIAFSGYALVRFVGEIAGIESQFRLK